MTSDTGLLLFTIGLPGSGKTTWAREVQAECSPGRVKTVSLDDMRRMLDREPTLFNHNNEKTIKRLLINLVTELIAEQYHVIVHNTHLSYGLPKSLFNATICEARFVNFLTVPTQTCLERNAKRTTYRVPDNIMEAMISRAGLIHFDNKQGFDSWEGIPVVTPQEATSLLMDSDS